LDDESRQTTETERIALRKQVGDALDAIISLEPAVDKTDIDQRKAAISEYLQRCIKYLEVRSKYLLKNSDALREVYEHTGKADSKALKRMRSDFRGMITGIMYDNMETNAIFLIDNAMISMLTKIVSILITASVDTVSEMDSMRNTMDAYAQVMGKFKTLVEDKKEEKPVESWFNVIWERQKKRGVIG
jgi:hypothetical protein